MKRTSESCKDKDRRRRDIRGHELNGIDYVEVDETQTVITVYFLGKAPANLTIANVRIDGGRRVRNLRVKDIHVCSHDDPRADGCLQITVDRPGDFSTYTLRFVQPNSRGQAGDEPMPGFDERHAQLEFSFKAGCPTGLDCVEVACAPQTLTEPRIDYLAKDYASFRQLILDRLTLLMPDWKERHVPDLGIALVEVLAYAGDHLSYNQDAVATEAYLGTARQRISVRRHAKLVDYQLHEGCNSRAWVYLETDTDRTVQGASFISPTKNRVSWNKSVLDEADMRGVLLSDYEVYEPVGEREGRMFYAAHGRIAFYTWGDRECCLPKGATSATLVDEWIGGVSSPPEPGEYDAYKKYGCDPEPPPPPRPRNLHLEPGDVLIFEEVLGPGTGQAADADPLHRHVVRLTRVEPGVDELYEQPVVEIEWALKDALPFALCISAIGRAPDCRYLENVSVAHGNVILVDHGRYVEGEGWDVPPAAEHNPGCLAEGEPIEELVPAAPFRPAPLKQLPVTHAVPYPVPKIVARRQAQLLARLMQRVHVRVEELWRASGDGDVLTEGEIEELTRIFGARAVNDSGVTTAGTPQRKALAWLLSRETRLLAKKSRRVRILAARARAGYVLDSDEREELVELFGERLAAYAGIGSNVTLGPASLALIQSPRDAMPQVRLTESSGTGVWEPRPDLLDSSGDDRHFVVEIDDDARAHLRFGDGDGGRAPSPATTLSARYRAGNGTRGNVGAEAISKIVFWHSSESGANLRVRNPLPAQGGTEPEPVAEAKLYAPFAFRRELERAVISDDYATLAERSDPPAIQRAAAPPLRWMGSWYEAQVAIDPKGTEELEGALQEAIDEYLERYRRIGHDLRVMPASYVALDIALSICVLPHYLRAHVEAELHDLFSNRDLGTGRRGFFHPDNLSFGDGVKLSRLVAAAQSVTGVENVIVTRLQRLYEQADGEIDAGILPLAALEVARLDNDRGAPEHGKLELSLGGGR